MRNQRPDWIDLPTFRLIGHPAVFGLICFGLFVAVALLIVALAQGAAISEVGPRLLSLLVTGFGVWVSVKSLKARRRQRFNRSR